MPHQLLSPMLAIHSKLPNVGSSIFSVMSKLANEAGAINLSQGFPDYDCPPELIDLTTEAMKRRQNQYAPMQGLMLLRQRIAEKVNNLHGSDYKPENDVTVTAGGTQAIFTALASFIRPGDEVIIFEPAYDCYSPTIELFGGITKPFVLSPPDYKINWQAVLEMVTVRTKMIIINSPQNPSATMLSEEDMQQLISIIRGTDIIILSDEVYEHLVYDGRTHLSVARYQELRERSFIVASFGKLFHTTGWKLGYCIAPSALMAEFQKVHQFLVFSVNTPMQYAAAEYLSDKSTYQDLPAFFQQKKDYFAELMKETRFNLLPCHGSYFQSVSYRHISDEKDVDFAQRLITEFGVASIPTSAFYSNRNDYGILRFCFAKKQETLEIAAERLMKV